jgi:hypothetical protein
MTSGEKEENIRKMEKLAVKTFLFCTVDRKRILRDSLECGEAG